MDVSAGIEFEVSARREEVHERRSESRESTRQPVTLRLLPLDEDSIRVPAYVMDISPGGLGIQSPLKLPQGAYVRVRLQTGVYLVGEVRHTSRLDDQYYSGVQIQNITA